MRRTHIATESCPRLGGPRLEVRVVADKDQMNSSRTKVQTAAAHIHVVSRMAMQPENDPGGKAEMADGRLGRKT